MDDLDFQKAIQEIKDGIKARRATGRDGKPILLDMEAHDYLEEGKLE